MPDHAPARRVDQTPLRPPSWCLRRRDHRLARRRRKCGSCPGRRPHAPPGTRQPGHPPPRGSPWPPGSACPAFSPTSPWRSPSPCSRTCAASSTGTAAPLTYDLGSRTRPATRCGWRRTGPAFTCRSSTAPYRSKPDDVLELTFAASLSDDPLHPDHQLQAALHTADGQQHCGSLASPHHGGAFRSHAIYRELFPRADRPPDLAIRRRPGPSRARPRAAGCVLTGRREDQKSRSGSPAFRWARRSESRRLIRC